MDTDCGDGVQQTMLVFEDYALVCYTEYLMKRVSVSEGTC